MSSVLFTFTDEITLCQCTRFWEGGAKAEENWVEKQLSVGQMQSTHRPSVSELTSTGRHGGPLGTVSSLEGWVVWRTSQSFFS